MQVRCTLIGAGENRKCLACSRPVQAAGEEMGVIEGVNIGLGEPAVLCARCVSMETQALKQRLYAAVERLQRTRPAFAVQILPELRRDLRIIPRGSDQEPSS